MVCRTLRSKARASRRSCSLAGALAAALLAGGCGFGAKPPPPPAKPAATPSNNGYTPYLPTTRAEQADPPEALPTAPKDAQPGVSLTYSVEIWEVLLPADTLSSDEAFWKRVNEQVVELPTHDLLYKNGFRIGELPIRELGSVSRLIDERQGKRTQIVGIAGRQMEIPIKANVDRQTLFYFDRSNRLIGRSFDRCENVMYFSFETTPREPDQIRLALTPAVRGKNKIIQFATVYGKADREWVHAAEESIYDASLRLDLPLQSVLIVAPSLDAKSPSTLGAAFMMSATPSMKQERLLVIIPRAYTKDAPQVSTQGK